MLRSHSVALLMGSLLCLQGCSSDDGDSGGSAGTGGNTGGSGGSAGTGGGSASPTLTATCTTYCDVLTQLDCTDPDKSACVGDCTALGTGIPSCADKFEAAISCISEEGTVVCDPTGGTMITGCAQERGEANTCLSVVRESACSGYCTKYLALPCADTELDQAACEANCVQLMGMVCPDELLLAYTCVAERGGMTCDANDEVVVTGCDAEQAAAESCAGR